MKAPASALILTLALLWPAGPSAAQPTDEQLAAIKSNCRSDFMSNCWGVPRGGAEAFQCLKKHLASLSSGCADAVKAVTPPAPAAVAKPAPAPAPAEATPPAAAAAEPATTETPPSTETTEAKPAAPAAASDAASASPPKAASETAAKPVSPAPPVETESAPPAKSAKAEAPAAAAAPSSVAAPEAVPALPADTPPIIGFLPPRKKLMVLKNCRQDLDTYCPDVSYGEGRQLQCLFSNKASLTPDCQGALAKLTQ